MKTVEKKQETKEPFVVARFCDSCEVIYRMAKKQQGEEIARNLEGKPQWSKEHLRRRETWIKKVKKARANSGKAPLIVCQHLYWQFQWVLQMTKGRELLAVDIALEGLKEQEA